MPDRFPSRYLLFAASISVSALIGCLGGDLDRPTVQPIPKDTTAVVDTLPTKPIASAHQLYPALKAGEKWTFGQWGDGYSGAEAILEIAGDSVYGKDSVYIELMTVHVPQFLTGLGDTVRQFTQTGRMYLRKSDQETVRDTLTTNAVIRYAGDTADTRYRLEAGSIAALSGTLPDSLKDGAAWKLVVTRRRISNWFFDDVPNGTRDTTWTQTRNYAVAASPDVTVKAGTFSAFKITWTVTEDGSTSAGWFAPAAKSMIREYDSDGSSADTTELASFTVK